jgi:uncharacterized protein YjiS (DUF1127 family)
MADKPMVAISVPVGEALRIQSGGGLALVFHPDGRAWEIEIVPRRDPWWQRWIRAWHEDRQARILAQLDERTLEDVGMGPGSGNPVAARAREYRHQEMRRMAMAQLSLL